MLEPRFALLFLAAACAATGFDGRAYRDSELAFRVGPVPDGWRQARVDGTRIAFRDDAAHASVMLNGRCGLDGDDVPLSSLTQHLFLQFTARKIESEKTLALDGRDALRTELVAALDGVPKHYLVVVLKKNGCVYDFVHVSDGAPTEATRAEFDAFVGGFATLEDGP